MPSISLGYSPCPNDTFIFYAMVHGRINTGDLQFREVLLDVETLNRKAVRAELDMTKISFHAFGHLRDTYRLMRSGGALGQGCGPLVVARDEITMQSLHGKRIAIPGRHTTACLLLMLYDSAFAHPLSSLIEMPFHTIMDSVAKGDVDAGLIIHESRFTYPSYGLREVIDLGSWWEGQTGLPVPLGGIIAKQTLGAGLHEEMNKALRHSIEFAFEHRSEPMNYIKEHSRELSEEVINQHINLYVNDYSVDIGSEGEKAVTELMTRAEDAGIIPRAGQRLFA